MNPTENDVLSGRGAWFNQHPGNKRFRKMLEENKDAYMTGTKKQKMDISKAIVEAIYSMDPPGRFLKKCPSTGQWNELSARDAADRVAQAMAYAVRGKDKSKRRREERRRSLLRKSQGDGDDLDVKPSQGAAQPIHPQQHATHNHFGGNVASSAAQGLTPRRGEALGASSGMPPAREQPHMPGNSNLQQQLLQQLQQSSSNNATLPTNLGNSIVDQNVNQNGLAQLLLQMLQQQQQIPLQYTVGQNPLGQLLQYPLQPALQHEGLTQLLAQAQQQQHNAQEQLLLQHLLNQQNLLSSASLTPSISSLSAPYMTGTRSQPQPANINLLQTLQQQSNPANVLLLNSVLSNLQYQPNPNAAISNAPQEVQQLDQLQRSLMLQQNQLLASSLNASSNNQLPSQQQQLQLLDPLLQQTLQATLQLQQNSQGFPPPSINLAGLASANIAAQSTRQEGREDEEQGEPEEFDSADD
mmetsp:Transcript_18925/g.28554  ORF Transcript_18925/g.28554 Transcript_18925/m.28554 type:complete len:468 (+) Transcript_18925:178-1581(+)